MRSASLVPVLPALMALLAGAPSWAGTTEASVTVGITLSQPGGSGVTPVPPSPGQPQRPGVCVSRSLSEQTGAVVQVACDSGQFVSIEAVPGQRFLGVHGGAFRYTLSIAKDRSVYEAAASDAFGWRTGWGTVTMLRLYDLTQPNKPGDVWGDRPLELRVSF
jgi:hypothetical protein